MILEKRPLYSVISHHSRQREETTRLLRSSWITAATFLSPSKQPLLQQSQLAFLWEQHPTSVLSQLSCHPDNNKRLSAERKTHRSSEYIATKLLFHRSCPAQTMTKTVVRSCVYWQSDAYQLRRTPQCWAPQLMAKDDSSMESKQTYFAEPQ